MRKKNCFKKLGAVVMAVAMTAMMIPGVVFAGDPNQDPGQNPGQAPEKTKIPSINIDVAKPEAGAEIPELNPVEKTEYYALLKGSETATQGTIALGWTQNKTASTGTFKNGEKYSFLASIFAMDGYEITEDTVVTIGGVKADLVDTVTDGPLTHLIYGAEFTVGETASTSKITDGDDNETIKATTGKDLVLKCDKDLPDEGFKFYFGGNELTPNECKVEKGSTIVTVYASYLDTLPGGDYEVTFAYPDGNITNTVTLTKAAAEEKAPQTGEFSSMATTILLISLLGLAGLGFYAKKKEFF